MPSSASSVTGVQTCALPIRSEEHTSELQSHLNLVCRLLLEKKKKRLNYSHSRISKAPVVLKKKKKSNVIQKRMSRVNDNSNIHNQTQTHAQNKTIYTITSYI